MTQNTVRSGEHLPPDYEHFIHALRSVGYSFEESVADIVDNSIDAGASHISIRFVIRENGAVDLLVADNGQGMDAAGLRDAMVFGTQPIQAHQKRLGKFGLGLKMASIAQAMNVHVVSHANKGQLVGRVWTDGGLKKGFFCEDLSRLDIDAIVRLSRTPSDEGHGTWVLWEYLHRYASEFGKSHQLCSRLITALEDHLGMHFHRFLDRVKITIDVIDHNLSLGYTRSVRSYDPFGYPSTGCEGYPANFNATGSYSGKLGITAHIWPPKSNSPNYRLPGGAVKRQGLFFYRNDRLISGGGWFDIKDGLDTHDSLGRVEIDLTDTELEREVSLDVRKALVKVTPALRDAIRNSTTDEGVSFKDYLKAVNKAYRSSNAATDGKKKKQDKGVKEAPKTIGFTDGMKGLIDKLTANPQADLIGGDVAWKPFDEEDQGLFFRISDDGARIELNERFRPLFVGAEGDQLVRTLLFLLLGEHLCQDELTPDEENYLRKAGELLAASALNPGQNPAAEN